MAIMLKHLYLCVVHIDLICGNTLPSPPRQYWIEELQLTLADKECISKGEWLNDTAITAAQMLLKKNFPQIYGMQSPIFGETPAFEIQKGIFIQILNVRNAHWIMVTSINCRKDEVRIFDSLPSEYVPSRTKQQIASILFSSKQEITLTFPIAQVQQDSQDCGLFSIAFAVSLCFGEDPCCIEYDQSKFRQHLLSCYEQSKMMLFPSKRKKRAINGKLFIKFLFL